MTDSEKLAAYEAMHAEIQRRMTETERQLEGLREKGRTKSATYRELLGWKLYYKSTLDLYKRFGL